MSAGEIINCEDTKNGKERSGSSGDPLVVSIGKIINKGGKLQIFWWNYIDLKTRYFDLQFLNILSNLAVLLQSYSFENIVLLYSNRHH